MIPPYQHGIPEDDDWEEEEPAEPTPAERIRDAFIWAFLIVGGIGLAAWLALEACP